MAQSRQVVRWMASGMVALAALALLVAAAGTVMVRSPWGRNQLRLLVVSQAGRYLAANLEIDALDGSLLSGLELRGVRLTRNGATLVAIERLTASYSIRQLFNQGTSLGELVLDRPSIVASRSADGRWDFADLIRRSPSPPEQAGQGRRFSISRLEIRNGSVTLLSPTTVGAAHIPGNISHLDAALAVHSEPGTWAVDFEHASFEGLSPTLSLRSLDGGISGDADGVALRRLHVVTPQSDFEVDGRVDRGQAASVLALNASAERFAFQEWAGILPGLRNIAVTSAFELKLTGPPSHLQTHIDLKSSGGDVQGDVNLDTTVPGWHATGRAVLRRLNVARWLNRPDRPSDISGGVDLDIDLDLGGHFPRGTFAFAGSHVGYLEYEADDVVARGVLTDTEVQIASVTATAYGSNVRLERSRLGIDSPNTFHFTGVASGIDLRQLPRSVPVPHVASTLAFDFETDGQFTEPFIRGEATFGESIFLGARVHQGAHGSIDTQPARIRYAGEGSVDGIDLNLFGRSLEADWLADPRYAGTLSGHFSAKGEGTDGATMTLTGGGRISESSLFEGSLHDADVTMTVEQGSLNASFDGAFSNINPSVLMADAAYAARMSGRAQGHIRVRDVLIRPVELGDYALDAVMSATAATVRGVDLTSAESQVMLKDGTLRVDRLAGVGPAIEFDAQGMLELDGVRPSRLDYHIARGDLAGLRVALGRDMSGSVVTSGVLSGPSGQPRFTGKGTVEQFGVGTLRASTTNIEYDAALPVDDQYEATASVSVQAALVTGLPRDLNTLTGELTYDRGRVIARLDAATADGLTASANLTLDADLRRRQVDVQVLSLAALHTAWTLAPPSRPSIAWSESSISVAGLDLTDAGTGEQHLSVDGTWTMDNRGSLRLEARHVSIDTLAATTAGPAPYGGVLDGTAVLTGTREHPVITSDFSVTEGRVQRLDYQTLKGHIRYTDGLIDLDTRLDQAPGVWLTVVGSVSASAFDRTAPPAPVNLTVRSSRVSLALVEGLSNLVRAVSGEMELDVAVTGTTRDPHFVGRVDVRDAAFEVRPSGARYRNGRLALRLTSDRVNVETFRVDDEDGHRLDITGSLGTRELRVGDLQVGIRARDFQVVRNEYGRVTVDAQLNLSGVFESPKLTGRVTITGGSIAVDRILDRTLFEPYSTQPTAASELDPIAVLNPWERMGMDIELHIPGSLRMTGDNVQVTPGTPLGLGNINLRVFGDLYLYKDPAKPLFVNGALDSLTGTYAFQGRRFDLDPSSAIMFRGDLNPDLYVTVSRIISSVETRVSIFGTLERPELRLASTPPLDPSDILSLIVFNTSTNELSALQQQQLAVRAGTLAAGFLAAPMLSALERTLGIDTLEIDTGADIRGGPRVTVGNEIAPGLVARFSRQFGPSEYDEATLEYYLSRILRIRATFSDANSLTAGSPFRRVERAGVDLLLFFSF